jgi:hypothetical protein
MLSQEEAPESEQSIHLGTLAATVRLSLCNIQQERTNYRKSMIHNPNISQASINK